MNNNLSPEMSSVLFVDCCRNESEFELLMSKCRVYSVRVSVYL